MTYSPNAAGPADNMRRNGKAAFLILWLLFSTPLPAGAADPFADVRPEHWSYRAVSELVSSGLVDDYANSMFRKDRRITRYALAQLVGQALYRRQEAAPEQREVIGRLAEEYREELTRMGAAIPAADGAAAREAPAGQDKPGGLKGLTVSGFFQTENSYGRRYQPSDAKHEYELEARLQFEQKLSKELTYTHQIATKTYFDDYSAHANDNLGYEYPNGNKEKVYTRLAYLDWRPGRGANMRIGKQAVWLADGLLGDDYVKGVFFQQDTAGGISASFLASRYSANTSWPGMAVISDGQGGYALQRSAPDRNIWYAGITKKFGVSVLGLHYLSADGSFISPADSEIYAATFAADWRGLQWSLGYARNIREPDSSLYKAQAVKNFGSKDSVILQYWYSGRNINLPLEHGNHTAFWTDTYSNMGLRGGRLIYSHNFTENVLLELFYGYYEALAENYSASKYGFVTTVSF